MEIPVGFTRVKGQKYMEFCERLGASNLSKWVKAGGNLVGYRSNRYCYVDSKAYKLVMDTSWYTPSKKQSSKYCPTCKSQNIEEKPTQGYSCHNCGSGFMY